VHRLHRHRGLTHLAAEAAFRDASVQALAILTRLLGDLDAAEEAVQEAFVVALERWNEGGVPDNPTGWIVTAARNKAIDRVRREAQRGEKQAAAHRSLAALDGWDAPDETVVRDDMLRLVFIACHPDIPIEGRVALALRTLCGLSALEIARLFGVSESAMAQRLVRAKRRIAELGLPYRAPASHELPERLPGVLGTVHLLFTEGHNATMGATHLRATLCREAIRLAQLLADLMPDESEVLGLLALLLVTDARRDARVDAQGDVVLLADQDRTVWDQQAIEQGVALLERSLKMGPPGMYQLEAAISACHSTARSYDDTDWCEILALYELLGKVRPSPFVALNRAVAVAECRGLDAGLDAVRAVEGLDGHHLRWAVEADVLRRLDRVTDARDAYERALRCEPNDAERRFLERRVASLAR
jgi:RNA polymerase sigma-70 factor (ECF subfamily)